MNDLIFNKMGVKEDAVMWTVEYKGLVYRFDSYIPDDVDTKCFISAHLEELELFVKYDSMNVWRRETKIEELEFKVWRELDNLFSENDIDVFGLA